MMSASRGRERIERPGLIERFMIDEVRYSIVGLREVARPDLYGCGQKN